MCASCGCYIRSLEWKVQVCNGMGFIGKAEVAENLGQVRVKVSMSHDIIDARDDTASCTMRKHDREGGCKHFMIWIMDNFMGSGKQIVFPYS